MAGSPRGRSHGPQAFGGARSCSTRGTSALIGVTPIDFHLEFDDVARRLQEVHGLGLADGRPAPEGESGGAWFARMDGTDVVVKWVERAAAPRFEVIAAALSRARERGVPVPMYRDPLVIGEHCVLIQESMPGRVGPPTPALVADVAAAVDRLAGLRAPHHVGGTWGSTIVRSLREGLEGWCEHGALLAAGGSCASIVLHARSVGGRVSEAMFPSDDLMHMDLHTKNVLQDRAGRLAAIVDWESACAGDSRFDLAYFAFAADVAQPHLARDLWVEVERCTPLDVVEAYVAHMVLRMADWSLRHHGPQAVERWLDAGAQLISRRS